MGFRMMVLVEMEKDEDEDDSGDEDGGDGDRAADGVCVGSDGGEKEKLENSC